METDIHMSRPDTPVKGDTSLLSPLKVAGIYAVFGMMWIVFSDRALHFLVGDPDMESQLQTWKGWAFILVTAVLVYGLTHRLVKNIHKAHNDLQALNQTLEEHVVKRTAELSAKEAYLRAVVDNSAEAIITLDNWGHIETFNPAAQKIFGYTEGQVIGQKNSMLFPPEQRAAHEDFFQDAGQIERKLVDAPRDLKGQRHNGEIFPLKMNMSKMRIEGHTKFVGIIRDMTER